MSDSEQVVSRTHTYPVLAEAVRAACLDAAMLAYEDAGSADYAPMAAGRRRWPRYAF